MSLCPTLADYYVRKRKLSKPAGGEEAAEGDLAKPTRRRKKRKAIFVQKKRRSSAVDYTPAGSPQVAAVLIPSFLTSALFTRRTSVFHPFTERF